MKTQHSSSLAGLTPAAVVAVCLAMLPAMAHAQGKRKNPSSKVYITDVKGDASIDTGDAIEDLTKRSVYTAQGTVIETKRAENESDRAKHFSTMVFSNGTGAFFDADTSVEVRKFVQEPFTPNRTDNEVEPSISQTQAFVARGSVGLCNSKLVAGSAMNYQTALGSVNIRGKKVVIEVAKDRDKKDITKISMMEGESIVRAGAMDMGGHTLRAGEQAIIRAGESGQPNVIQITKIPDDEMSGLDDKVTMACNAKKTVYFDVREKQETLLPGATSAETAAALDNSAAAGAETPGSTPTNTPGGPITAFDGNNGTSSVTIREIVPVVVVPVVLPDPVVVSPSRLITRTPGG